jgi:hypothetical protein
MRNKPTMVHCKPHAAGRTLASKASTEGTGPGADKGQSTDRRTGTLGATVKVQKVFRFSPRFKGSRLLNEKSGWMVEFLFSIGRQHDA